MTTAEASGRRSNVFSAGNAAMNHGSSSSRLNALAEVISAAARPEVQSGKVFCSRRARSANSIAVIANNVANRSFTELPACRM